MEYNRNGQYLFENYEPQKKRRGIGAFGIIVIILLVVLIAVTCVFGVVYFNYMDKSGGGPLGPVRGILPDVTVTPAPDSTVIPYIEPTPTPNPADREMPALDGQAPSVAVDSENPIPDIFEAVAPSVVGVVNYTMQSFGDRQMLEIYGSGTGFVVSAGGYILTNAHVIDGAQKVTVLLNSGEEVDATVIGADNETDVAVLKIEHDSLVALAIGDSENVRIGEYALAIGNPLDSERLANTLTFGIISATAREITIDGHTNTYLQTDAAINFGNSGGPLLNLKGEVIGMNSAKSVTAGYDEYGNAIGVEGIGFALPINTVVEVMRQLIEDGYIERPAVGITVYTLTEAMAAELKVPQGVYVDSVVRGGPASEAGLRAGDVILAANGRAISDQAELIAIINEAGVGATISLHVYRAGEEFDCTVALGDKNAMNFSDTEKQE